MADIALCRPDAASVTPPPPPPPTRQQRLTDLATRLSRTVALARGLAQGGRRLDLTGVDDGIGVLCAQTLDLPPDEARMMRPVLLHVLAQVDLLSAALRSPAGASGRPC